MTAKEVPSAESEWFDEMLAIASPDALREMITRTAEIIMDTEVEQRCGTSYGEAKEDT